MARDDDDEEFDDWEDPDESDQDDDPDDSATVDCSYCGEEIAADAQVCRHCRKYVSKEDAPPQRKPLWIIVGAVAVLISMLICTLKLFALR